MNSLINPDRPPAYCPGCSHEVVTRALDRCFQNMGIDANRVVLVSDIGCSGLFDTFFNTHAFHGLHGRALTYATGIKLARPDLHVVVTMGDGGLGIGGAHLLSTCRRNIDVTLMILNNFNYGMTGGQFSATTPTDAHVGSGFLNQIEKPMDPCLVMQAAGAAYVSRVSAYPAFDGPIPENSRPEYGRQYRQMALKQKPGSLPPKVAKQFTPLIDSDKGILILGSAGQRIITAGEILCLAGLTAGLHASQKNDYPITVLRGHSATDVILSPQKIAFSGIETPNVVLALGQEGVDRRKALFSSFSDETLIITDSRVTLPECRGNRLVLDFKTHKVKRQDMAMASLACLAKQQKLISMPMLKAALGIRFKGKALQGALALVQRAAEIKISHQQ